MSNFTQIIDGSAGSALHKAGTTVQTFALSLAAGATLFGVQFTAFAIFRNYLWSRRIYQPRSFLVPLKARVKPPPNNLPKWLYTVFNITSATEVLHKAGMDAYFFLRYLTMGLKIFLPTALFTLPILLPLNIVDGKGTTEFNGTTFNVTGLDRLAWTNVSPQHTSRYWAHLILAVGVVTWCCYVFHQEMTHYIHMRQRYLSSPSHRLKASSTTVLITNIPADLCTIERLTELYDDFPGGVRRMWINTDYEKILERDAQRRKVENILENAETNLIRKAIKKSLQSGISTSSSKNVRPETLPGDKNEHHLPEQEPSAENSSSYTLSDQHDISHAQCSKDLQYDIRTDAVWTRYLTGKDRETMRIAKPNHSFAFNLPLIGRLFGEKVDTIYYCRRQLAHFNEVLQVDIDQLDTLQPNGSAFIQFNTQKAAHLACQAIADTEPRKMSQRRVEVSPADINWAALDQSWIKRFIRLVLFIALFIILIIVFGIISFFTGILSRVSTLSATTPWLRWIARLPPWLLSFLQGSLPPFIQIIVLSGPTPIVLRAMTNRTRAAVTRSQGERSLQHWYFVLLLLELFIIPTISAGLTSIVREIIQSSASVPQILATNLPTAANYYFSFLIVQALSISASSICQTVRLFNFYVIGGVNTPDSLYAKLTFTHFTRIGSNIPWYTTFMVIGLVYSVIAPLMSVFVLLTLSLFWIVIKNNVLYVVRTGDVDSGALWFPHAITQTFTGLYFMEVCLIGLFFLVRNTDDEVACEAQGIIMAVVLILTILYQIWLITTFSGLVKYAPLRLEAMAARGDREYEMERLAPDTTHAKSSGHEPDVSNDMCSTCSPEKYHVAVDKEVTPPNLNHFTRERGVSSVSNAVSDRTKEMSEQKEHDKVRAKHILARLNRPLDEPSLSIPQTQSAAAEESRGNVLLPRSKDIEARMLSDPISKIIMQHNQDLEDLTPEERDMLISVAFTHPIIRDSKPSIWIPRDDLGISDDEVRRTRALSQHLFIDNRGAFFNRKLKVQIDMAPPETSQFALIMRDL